MARINQVRAQLEDLAKLIARYEKEEQSWYNDYRDHLGEFQTLGQLREAAEDDPAYQNQYDLANTAYLASEYAGRTVIWLEAAEDLFEEAMVHLEVAKAIHTGASADECPEDIQARAQPFYDQANALYLVGLDVVEEAEQSWIKGFEAVVRMHADLGHVR